MKSLVLSLAAAFGIIGIVFLPESKMSDHSEFKSVSRPNCRARSLGQFEDPKSVSLRRDLNEINTDDIQFEMCPANLTQDVHADWSDYRLSDALMGYLPEHAKEIREDYAARFGATIVEEYFALTDSKYVRPDVLYEVMKPKLLTAANDAAVLHLQLGDTTCPHCWNTEQPPENAKRLSTIYAFNKAYYEYIIKQLRKDAPEITSIIIAASTYHGTSTDASEAKVKEEIKDVRDLFLDSGYQVSQRINCGTPDEEFIFMASHKYFITGGGGYSKLVANVVENNGGQVFYDPKYLCEWAQITQFGYCNYELLCDVDGITLFVRSEKCMMLQGKQIS